MPVGRAKDLGLFATPPGHSLQSIKLPFNHFPAPGSTCLLWCAASDSTLCQRAWINDAQFATVSPPPKVLSKMFKRRFLKKRTDHPPWKASLFVGHEFPYERGNQPYFKIAETKDVLVIYRVMQRSLVFLNESPILDSSQIGRCFMSLCSAHKRTQHKSTSILESFHSHYLRLAPYVN